MRTVAFSNPKVIRLLEKNFICAWKNVSPKTKFRDGLYTTRRTARIVKGIRPGTGQTNICAFVVSTEGKIIHAIQGYHDAKSFISEVNFGMKLAKAKADDLPGLYKARRKKLKGSSRAVKLLRRNLRTLESWPLPELKGILGNRRAGLR